MDLNEIKALMDRFDTSACTVLELEEGNLRPLERLRPSPLRRRRGRP